jgi:WD40 repeat protein
MKVIKGYKDNLLVFLGLMIFFLSSVEIMAMKMSPAAIKLATARILKEKVKQLKTGEYFIYKAGTTNGVVVPLVALQKSEILDSMSRDVGKDRRIPIKDYSFDEIKSVCDFLKSTDQEKEGSIQYLPLKDLINRINLLNAFLVSNDNIKMILAKMNTKILHGNEKIDILKNNLNDDLQRLLMVDPVIDYLKSLIIKTKDIIRPTDIIMTEGNPILTFDPTGNKIVSCQFGNLILWDISNPKKIIKQTFDNEAKTHSGTMAMDINLNGNKVICADLNEFILWNIDDLKNVTTKKFGDGRTRPVVFNHKGNKIIGHSNEGFILWDISNQNNITYQLLGQVKGLVNSIAFSPDDNEVVCGTSKGIVLLRNIQDENKITSQYFMESRGVVDAVAFSPDGKKIASYGKEGFVLWDVENLDKPVFYPIMKKNCEIKNCEIEIKELKFSSDGNNVFLCYLEIIDKYMLQEKTQTVFTVWNVSDLKNVTEQVIIRPPVRSKDSWKTVVKFSNDGNKILLTGDNPYSLYLYILLTDNQAALLNSIKNYTLDQILLLYELYVQSVRGGVPEKDFGILPGGMKNLLKNLGFVEQKKWWS